MRHSIGQDLTNWGKESQASYWRLALTHSLPNPALPHPLFCANLAMPAVKNKQIPGMKDNPAAVCGA